MDKTLCPSSLFGVVRAVASKSMAHRLLILAALSPDPCDLRCSTTSEDIEATKACLRSLLYDGDAQPKVRATDTGTQTSAQRLLDCGESGSTLRFLLPVVGALGASVRILRHGRLSERPLAPFDDELAAHGMHIKEAAEGLLVKGRLHGGRFVLPGDVSSQFTSGLLMAAPLLEEATEILVAKPVQSAPYIDLTIHALHTFGVAVRRDCMHYEGRAYARFAVSPTTLRAPAELDVEGDWSNAAFWLAAGAMEPQGITVDGLDLASAQGDRAILAALSAFGGRIARKGNAARATMDTARSAELDVQAIPDLVPPLAAVAATAPGVSRLRNAGRLRLKESDRLESVTRAITALGGNAWVEDDALVIQGVEHLSGGTVDAANDHRIAMMAAIMATHAQGPVTILGAECVSKSYPAFWDDYCQLGGLEL
jgi:3-phosphoshikimate 1-carboxyvinyltransferase